LKRLSNKVDEGALKTLETTINEAEKPTAEINVNPFKLADQQAKKKLDEKIHKFQIEYGINLTSTSDTSAQKK